MLDPLLCWGLWHRVFIGKCALFLLSPVSQRPHCAQGQIVHAIHAPEIPNANLRTLSELTSLLSYYLLILDRAFRAGAPRPKHVYCLCGLGRLAFFFFFFCTPMANFRSRAGHAAPSGLLLPSFDIAAKTRALAFAARLRAATTGGGGRGLLKPKEMLMMSTCFSIAQWIA